MLQGCNTSAISICIFNYISTIIIIITISVIIIIGKIFWLARKVVTRLLFLVKQKSFLSKLNPVSKTMSMTVFIFFSPYILYN